MNISELKKSLENINKAVFIKARQFGIHTLTKDMENILSACQLLCDAIEKGKIDVDKLQ